MTDQPAPPESAPAEIVDTGTNAANELGEFRSLKADVWRQFRRHKGAMAGVIMLTLVVGGCLVGPPLMGFDTSTPDVANANRGAFDWPHLFGTDNLGRDAFARALLGGRISLAVGFVAMAVSIIVGVLVGGFAGYFRWLDSPPIAVWTSLTRSRTTVPIQSPSDPGAGDRLRPSPTDPSGKVCPGRQLEVSRF